ncbi:Hypothetical protein ADU73_0399 [Pediococcus damnosus]|nr:Hypothetical protein ADU73_0399 [Pediococcus damnosus]
MIPFSNVLPVALVGAVFAMIEYFRTSETNELRTEIKGLKDSSNSGGGYNDGI